MDEIKFKAMLAKSSKDELVKVLNNTRLKKNRDFEDVVLSELDSRFPTWNKNKKPKKGGNKFNTAFFLEQSRGFETAKEGYLWLVSKFISEKPEIFDNPDSEIARIAIGNGRNFFAKSPKSLFKNSPHLAEVSSNYHELSNGWYANLNISNNEKFKILIRLSWAAGRDFEKDWNWVVIDSTDELLQQIERQKIASELLKELDSACGS